MCACLFDNRLFNRTFRFLVSKRSNFLGFPRISSPLSFKRIFLRSNFNFSEKYKIVFKGKFPSKSDKLFCSDKIFCALIFYLDAFHSTQKKLFHISHMKHNIFYTKKLKQYRRIKKNSRIIS